MSDQEKDQPQKGSDNGTQEDADRSGQRPGAGDVQTKSNSMIEKERNYKLGKPESKSTGSDGDPGIPLPAHPQSLVQEEHQKNRDKVLAKAAEMRS